MSKLIDKITFEVDGHPHHEQIKIITLLFMGNVVADTECYIGFSAHPYVSLSNIKLKLAKYLSLNEDDIKKIIWQFILDGGLGVDEIAYVI